MSREDDLRRCPVSAADTGSTCGRGLGQTVPGSGARAGECRRGRLGAGLPCDVLGQLGGVRRVELDVKGEVPGNAWQTERSEHFTSVLELSAPPPRGGGRSYIPLTCFFISFAGSNQFCETDREADRSERERHVREADRQVVRETDGSERQAGTLLLSASLKDRAK